MSEIMRPGFLDRRHDLGDRRNVAAREDVFLDPGRGAARAAGTADGMKQHRAIGGEEIVAGVEEGSEVPDADVLEHADRDDAIERPFDVAVILQQEADAILRARVPARGGWRR